MSDIMLEFCDLIYSSEGIELANQYLQSRGIDGARTQVPYTICTKNYAEFSKFEKRLQMPPPYQMASRLFIPILDPSEKSLNPEKIIGFETRYIGPPNPKYIRYLKIKNPAYLGSQFVYGVRLACERPHLPTVVTESVLDAESALQCAGDLVNSIAMCSALKGPRVLPFLLCVSDKVVLAYDNNAAGREGIVDMLEASQKSFEAAPRVTVLQYAEDDLNKLLTTQGPHAVRGYIANHLGFI